MNVHGKAKRDENEDEEHGGQHDKTERPQVQKRHIRPCKGKRDRFRQYVDKLKLQVDQDPEGFTLGSVSFPKYLTESERGRNKVASILEDYRTQLLSNSSEAQPIAGSSHGSNDGLPCNPDIVSL